MDYGVRMFMLSFQLSYISSLASVIGSLQLQWHSNLSGELLEGLSNISLCNYTFFFSIALVFFFTCISFIFNKKMNVSHVHLLSATNGQFWVMQRTRQDSSPLSEGSERQ